MTTVTGTKILAYYEPGVDQERIPMGPARPGDAGMDLCNAAGKEIIIEPGRSARIPAGIRVKVPTGYVGLIRPRSSTFTRRGLLVVESSIDEGYTGPLFVIVWNPSMDGANVPVVVQPWERLGQLMVVPYHPLLIDVVEVMPETERGSMGFGSSGA